MEEDDLEIAIKVLVVGNGGVGKSSLIQRYCKGTFTDGYKKTIGVDFLEKSLEIDGQEVKMMLWDTAGQEEFNSITKSYYRGANCCVLVFSITDRASFDAIEEWKNKVTEECGANICMLIVQNKMDLYGNPDYVSQQEGEELAKKHKMRLHRISVKNNEGVGPVFEHLCMKHLSNMKKQSQVAETPSAQTQIGMFSTTVTQKDTNKENGGESRTINLKPKRRTEGKKKTNLFRSSKCSVM